ncbi:uncharacterized protein [Dermacentor albipictus]|uniref:uncharacterized protein n=1 Tax=Dermacentor albipictus TaxID=60249 RepID=UPI0038FC859C
MLVAPEKDTSETMSSRTSENVSANGASIEYDSENSSFSVKLQGRQEDEDRAGEVSDLSENDSRDVSDATASCRRHCYVPDECGTWTAPASKPHREFRYWPQADHPSHPDENCPDEPGAWQEEELPLLGSRCSLGKSDYKRHSKRTANREPATSASDSSCTDVDTRDAFEKSDYGRSSGCKKDCRQTDENTERKLAMTASAAESSDDEDTRDAFESTSCNGETRASREDEDSNASDEDFNIAFIREPRKKYRSYIGIPLIFKKLDNTPPSFSEVCLCCAEQHIAAATQEAPLSLEVTRKGFLRVTVETTTAASILQDLDNLGELPVEVVLPRGYSDNVAKIANVPLAYTDSQIRKFFAPAGVVAAKRQVAYRTQPDGSVRTIPRDSVLLTFRPEREIPVRIRPGVDHAEALDYRYFPVRLHVTAPTQCYNCFRYGHMAKHCRRRVRCKVCAGNHSYKECVSRGEQRCGNCDGPHAATFGRCPVRLTAVRDKRFALRFDRRPRDGNCY